MLLRLNRCCTSCSIALAVVALVISFYIALAIILPFFLLSIIALDNSIALDEKLLHLTKTIALVELANHLNLLPC